MAKIVEDSQRVRVRLDQNELNALLVVPAQARGFIDFNPTRISTQPRPDGDFEIIFERLRTEGEA